MRAASIVVIAIFLLPNAVAAAPSDGPGLWLERQKATQQIAESNQRAASSQSTEPPDEELKARATSAREPYIINQYCRDYYGNTLWLSPSENPANCTLGYVKAYDSRTSQYVGAMDIYGLYARLCATCTLQQAYDWCDARLWCKYGVIVPMEIWVGSKIRAVYLAVKARKF
jgi:hypothetical protein